MENLEKLYKKEFTGRKETITRITKEVTMRDLYNYINNIFSLFDEYHGSIIYTKTCSIYFTPSDNNSKILVKEDEDSTNLDLSLTDFGKKLIFPYLSDNEKYEGICNINWGMYVNQKCDMMGKNVKSLLEITGIDIYKIVQEMFNNSNDKNYKWEIKFLENVQPFSKTYIDQKIQIIREEYSVEDEGC